MKIGFHMIVAGLALLACSSSAFATKVPLGPVQMPNGNWYELVPDLVDYPAALTAAAGRTLNGMQGHLVTITSADENTFVAKNVGTFIRAWIAASDAASEGNFVWTAGPETGQSLWTGGLGGSAVGFASFPPSEPNDTDGTEDAVEMFYFGGSWNDQDPRDLNCYVVEYEVVPEPAAGLFAIGALGLLAIRRKIAA